MAFDEVSRVTTLDENSPRFIIAIDYGTTYTGRLPTNTNHASPS